MKHLLTCLCLAACLAAGLRAAPYPTPNYADRLERHGTWRAFPVRVWFTHDENWSQRREDNALDGFDAWEDATRGYVRYALAASAAQAQVVVRFDPSNNDGFTRTWYRNGAILKAQMTIGVRRGAAVDVEAIAAHEFGHALGINGHSGDRRDLMYPVHMAGTPVHISERDLNTLASRYPALAARLAPPPGYREDGDAVDVRSTRPGATT